MFLWDLKAGQQNKNEKVHSFRCLYLKPLVLFFFFSTFSAVFFNKISVSSVFLSTCTWSSTLECILTSDYLNNENFKLKLLRLETISL